MLMYVNVCSCKLHLQPKLAVNPFLVNVPILYPLKTQKKDLFSSVFRGYKVRTLARNELNDS